MLARPLALPRWLRIRRLPEAVPISFGILVFLFAPGVPAIPCDDPYASVPMNWISKVCGVMFLNPATGRRLAALFWALLMPAAALYVAYMHHRGLAVHSCSALGPARLELTTHLGVLAILCAVATAVFLREETRVLDRAYGDEGDPGALRRLVRPFE